MPEHALVRDTHSHLLLMCRCGERPAGTTSPDEARKVLTRHILERQAR